MTEYDFSTEAYHRHMQTHARVTNWVSSQRCCAPSYDNPLQGNRKGPLPILKDQRGREQEREMRQQHTNHTRARSIPAPQPVAYAPRPLERKGSAVPKEPPPWLREREERPIHTRGRSVPAPEPKDYSSHPSRPAPVRSQTQPLPRRSQSQQPPQISQRTPQRSDSRTYRDRDRDLQRSESRSRSKPYPHHDLHRSDSKSHATRDMQRWNSQSHPYPSRDLHRSTSRSQPPPQPTVFYHQITPSVALPLIPQQYRPPKGAKVVYNYYDPNVTEIVLPEGDQATHYIFPPKGGKVVVNEPSAHGPAVSDAKKGPLLRRVIANLGASNTLRRNNSGRSGRSY